MKETCNRLTGCKTPVHFHQSHRLTRQHHSGGFIALNTSNDADSSLWPLSITSDSLVKAQGSHGRVLRGVEGKKKKRGGGIWLRGPTLRCLGADGVPLPLSLFWWRPLGIGEAFKHSFRGQRQISELCSSPPSGLRQRLACSWQVCACMCIHYSNSSGEGSGCVSIAIGPIPGERSAHTLASRPPPRCCVVIVNSDADFDKFFFFFFHFFLLFCPFSSCPPVHTIIVNKFRPILVQLTVSSWNIASVVTQREGARDDGRGPC